MRSLSRSTMMETSNIVIISNYVYLFIWITICKWLDEFFFFFPSEFFSPYAVHIVYLIDSVPICS
jgi:hypothetical protein